MVELQNLDSKLRAIHKKIGQKIVVQVGVRDGGKFDLLGVECLGEETPIEVKTKSCTRYIG